MDDVTKTTPMDVSEFERDQLRFFLGNTDMASTLAELNPSLAWLPILAEMNLLQNDATLPLWVEQNFESLEAIREVVKNIRFFRAESAAILHHRLAPKRATLPPLQAKCWQLIIRHIRNAPRATWQNEWYEVLPRLRRGDVSAEVLAQLTDVLTPKLFLESRWDLFDEPERKVEKPADVVTIKYRVGESVSDTELVEAWPKTVAPAIEAQFVRALVGSLSTVLSDAIDMELEGNVGFGISDSEVPSVAAHGQNLYHAGFLPIVRVIAEIWSKLAKSDAQTAREIVDEWQKSEYRLVRRLALYAAADPKIPAQQAANVLISLPQGGFFLTNAQVEVHRLLQKRWGDIAPKHRKLIEARIVTGPPVDWFREKADLGDVMDHHRFELLLDLERSKVPLGKQAAKLLRQIRKRHPRWRDTEPERAGFTIWHRPIEGVVGSSEKLSSVPSGRLIEAAKKLAKKDFFDGDSWQGLCQSDPSAAFHGIQQAPAADKWHEWAWRPLLWAANKIADPRELNHIAILLAEWPKEAPFTETASGAAFWLDQVSEKLDASALWGAWDFIERRSPRRTEPPDNDIFSTALNDPAGNLASVLLKRTPRPRGRTELGKALRARYERLIRGNDIFALLARIRMSAAIAFVFHQAPKWTTARLLRSYSWSSPNALVMWSARKYSNHIGTPELFRRLKKPFLGLFVRPEVPEEDLRVFSVCSRIGLQPFFSPTKGARQATP